MSRVSVGGPRAFSSRRPILQLLRRRVCVSAKCISSMRLARVSHGFLTGLARGWIPRRFAWGGRRLLSPAFSSMGVPQGCRGGSTELSRGGSHTGTQAHRCTGAQAHRHTGANVHARSHLGPWTREDLAFASMSEMMRCPSDLVPTLDKPADGGNMPCSASIQDSATGSSTGVPADCERSGPADCEPSGRL